MKCSSFSFLEVGRKGQTRAEDTHNQKCVKFKRKRLQTIVKKGKKRKKEKYDSPWNKQCRYYAWLNSKCNIFVDSNQFRTR